MNLRTGAIIEHSTTPSDESTKSFPHEGASLVGWSQRNAELNLARARCGGPAESGPGRRRPSSAPGPRSRPSAPTRAASRAFEASPTRRSTSAGRIRAGSVRTWASRSSPAWCEGDLDQAVDRVGDAGGDHVVLGALLLEHPPHRLDVVAGEAPVAAGVEVAQRQVLAQAELDAGHPVRDLARHELEAAPGRLVVEEDPRAGEEAVGLAVVDRDVVAVGLGDAVGAARVERASPRSGASRPRARTSRSTRPGRSGSTGRPGGSPRAGASRRPR